MESSGISGSPKTVKKVTSKTHAARKDLACLTCGMSLVGERCTFNVENHAGLRAKLESILEDSIHTTVQSSRVCRPCGRQTESLEKRYNVVMQQIREFRVKYSSCCRTMVKAGLHSDISVSICINITISISSINRERHKHKHTHKKKESYPYAYVAFTSV